MVVREKSKRKKTTAAELPEEVVRREILTRLPIKSVGRFKSVSKSWLSLFSDPQFVKQHLTYNTTQNPNNDYDCLIAMKDVKIVILSRYKEKTALLSGGAFGLVGSVRGLVCLSHDQKLSLWNPAIQQYKEFSTPPRRPRHSWYPIGFGFDPSSDIYKVVVLSRDLELAYVYNSNSNVWVDISVPDNLYIFLSGGIIRNLSTIVKDCPYWTFAKYTYNGYKKVKGYLTIVKFDTKSNEFELLPEFHVDTKLLEGSYPFSYQFVDLNDCPSVIVYDRNSPKCMLDLYSLNGEKGCVVWNKIYSIGPFDFHGRHVSVSQGFLGGEIVLQNLKMFYCYDRNTDTMKPLTTVPLVSCCRYTPSLVFLEGMKSVYLTTQTRRATALCPRFPLRLINSLRNLSFV